MHNDTAIIIPVFNEEQVIKGVVDTTTNAFRKVICIDDGSSDNTKSEILKTSAKLVSHTINLGQGASLQTGIEYARKDPSTKYFVTFDADGQHQLEDVEMMIKYIRDHPEVDIVLGSRFLGKTENMSTMKRWVLKLAIAFSNKTSGIKLTDAHNGLRVFNRNVAETLNISMNDMAHASEIVHLIHDKKYSYVELPVTIIYTDYSKAKGQAMMNSVNIIFDLLLRRLSK